jgi:hypothetical protein
MGWGLLFACAAGCTGSGDRSDSPAYLPGWPEARAAVATALADWRDTAPPHPPSRSFDGVQFVDKQRNPADRLSAFSILGETEVENARQFTVRLQLEGEADPRLVRYNVLGREPAWVFRLEDYEMISHWEHPMNEPAAGQPPPAAPDPAPSSDGAHPTRVR